nr:unnamed protein product [Spirometra erinaceieuropaei]
MVVLFRRTAEIRTLFPQGNFDPNITCAKPEVEYWWRRNFNQRVIVPKDAFFSAFFAKHVRFQTDNRALYETMAFTSESYVSKYALDLFTRLFSPWEKSYNVHKAITQHPAYLKQSTSSLIEEKLQALKDMPGSFYFRISANNPGIWSIGFVTRNGHISQVLCYGLPLIDTLYQSRHDLYVYPAGKPQFCDLSNDIKQGKQVFVKDDPTCDPLRCRICGENQIDVQFDQCGHMCCHCCDRSLMSAALKTTRGCRVERKDEDSAVPPPASGLLDPVREERQPVDDLKYEDIAKEGKATCFPRLSPVIELWRNLQRLTDLNSLNRNFICSSNDFHSRPNEMYLPPCDLNPVNVTTVEQHLKKVRGSTAAGPDGVAPFLLKSCC